MDIKYITWHGQFGAVHVPFGSPAAAAASLAPQSGPGGLVLERLQLDLARLPVQLPLLHLVLQPHRLLLQLVHPQRLRPGQVAQVLHLLGPVLGVAPGTKVPQTEVLQPLLPLQHLKVTRSVTFLIR